MANYFTLITREGLVKITNAQLTNSKLEITEVVVGDGNGAAYTPTGAETQVKRAVWRGGVTSVEVDAQNPNWIVAEAIIPATAGGFTIREVGLYDADGTLIAIGNYPDTYKPLLADGSAMDLSLRTIIEVSNASSVTLRIDPNVIVASRKYVDDKVSAVVSDIYYNAELSGVVGDGSRDDTAAMLHAKQYCITNKKTLYIPARMVVNLPNGLDLYGLRFLKVDGELKVGEGKRVIVGYSSRFNDPTKYDIYKVTTGTLQIDALKNADLNLSSIDHLLIFADGALTDRTSVAYNRFSLGLIRHFEVYTQNTGWVNENTFFKGRILRMTWGGDGTYINNHNIFYNPSLEKVEIVMNHAHSNSFLNCRFEGNTENVILMMPSTSRNVFISSWQSTIQRQYQLRNSLIKSITLTDNGKANIFLNQHELFLKPSLLIELTTNKNVNLDYLNVDSVNSVLSPKAVFSPVLETDFIPVTNKVLGYFIESDQPLWRLQISLYDQNKVQILQAPVIGAEIDSVLNGVSMSWTGENVFANTANRSEVGAYINTKDDTNIHFVKIRVLSGNNTANNTFKYLKLYKKESITSDTELTEVKTYPKFRKAGRPTAGDGNFIVGDVVVSTVIGPALTKSWVYNGTTWDVVETHESRSSASPEGVVSGAIGARHIDTNTRKIYFKTVDGGNTGWREVNFV